MATEGKVPEVRSGTALTALQEALVEAMLGGAKTRKAIEIAGYKDASAGYRALRTDAVQEAIMKGARAALVHDVGPALVALRRLLASNSEYVRLKASQDILDRAGLAVSRDQGMSCGTINVNINLGD